MRGTSRKTQSLIDLEQDLSPLDREMLGTMHRLSLVSGAQVRRLFFENSGNGRTDDQRARRALLRLTRLGVLARLERRIGGTKSGSEGFCYRVSTDGQRLLSWWLDGSVPTVRLREEPGPASFRHRLAVTELYVRMVEAGRDGNAPFEVLEFESEPESWRTYDLGFDATARTLKPDAFMKLGVGEFEHWWFCEIDLGSVGRRARESQASAYRSYWRSGAAGPVMPKVLWLTPNELVADRARVAIQPAAPQGLFVIAALHNPVPAATGMDMQESEV